VRLLLKKAEIKPSKTEVKSGCSLRKNCYSFRAPEIEMVLSL
jgi:hypothetical protein